MNQWKASHGTETQVHAEVWDLLLVRSLKPTFRHRLSVLSSRELIRLQGFNIEFHTINFYYYRDTESCTGHVSFNWANISLLQRSVPWSWFWARHVGYGLHWPQFESRSQKFVSNPDTSTQALGPIQRPVQLVPGFFPGDTAAGAWNRPPSPSAQVQKEWRYTSTSHTFLADSYCTILPKPLMYNYEYTQHIYIGSGRARAHAHTHTHTTHALRGRGMLAQQFARLLLCIILPKEFYVMDVIILIVPCSYRWSQMLCLFTICNY